jgi:hypothetical protein
MLRIVELLAIVSVAGIGFIGVQIVQGKGRLALISTIIFGIFLVFYNSYLEEKTGRGIARHLYCLVFACHPAEAPGNESSAPQANLAGPGQVPEPFPEVPNELVGEIPGLNSANLDFVPVDNGTTPVDNSSTHSTKAGRSLLELYRARTANGTAQPARR